MRPNSHHRAARAGTWAVGFALALFLTTAIHAQTAPPPLARYVPAEDLSVYFEFDGLDAHPEAWKKSAAARLLNETSLGILLEDLASQGINSMLAQGPPVAKPTGQDVIDLAKFIGRSGLVVAVSGKDPNSMRVMLVVRGGAKGVFRKFLDQYANPKIPGAEEQAPVEKAGRTLNPLGNGSWWAEKDDLVLASRDSADVIIETIDGKKPNATTHRIRAELAKAAEGVEQFGIGFADLKSLPPLPPQAAQLGLGGLERVEFRMGFHGDALVSELAAVAPAPRQGILELFDQPTFDKATLPPLPEGLSGFTVVSIDLAKTYEKLVAIMKLTDPNAGQQIEGFEKAISDQFGVRVKDDFLAHLGPKLSLYTEGTAKAGDNPIATVMGGGFDVTLAIQTDDQAAIAKVADKLVEVATQALAANEKRPEFRKAEGANPGYSIEFPPEELTGPFTNMRPTLLVGKDRLVIATKPPAARKAAALPAGGKGLWTPTEAFIPMVEQLPKDLVVLNVSDARDIVATLMSALPALIQNLNNQLMNAQRRGGGALPIKLDPNKIPKSEDLRSRLFPSSFTVAVDRRGIRLNSREALPSIYSPMASGVLIAMLLPARQAAQEAARRAQCVNNLKQMALAMHNYHAANNTFPAQAITDKDGKPLLSWRVAILPYLEQQDLYNKFKLDEPWDSEHNKALIKEMPQVFACPTRLNLAPGATVYCGFVGKGALWDEGKGTSLQNITDGSSNTIALVEAKDGVQWTKPGDLPFDPEKGKAPFGAGSDHPGGFNAAFADGSVRFIKMSIDANVLKALITRAGGEVIGANDF